MLLLLLFKSRNMPKQTVALLLAFLYQSRENYEGGNLSRKFLLLYHENCVKFMI